MKIVCMIGTPPYLNYFINEIARHHELALVIREDAHTNTNLRKKILKKGILNTARIVVNRLRNRKRLQKDYNEILGSQWQQPSGAFPLFNTPDINSKAVIQQLQEIKPDLVLVHGTSLIKAKTLAGIPLALNLHWGLSPYYKGSYCTEWALINHDPYNIGFTIHRMSSKIDAGDILTQAPVSIVPEDTANRINMRLTRLGTQEIVAVITRLQHGETPVFTAQDNNHGALYLTKDWTQKKQRESAALENPVSIKTMLDTPVRPALPVVTW